MRSEPLREASVIRRVRWGRKARTEGRISDHIAVGMSGVIARPARRDRSNRLLKPSLGKSRIRAMRVASDEVLIFEGFDPGSE